MTRKEAPTGNTPMGASQLQAVTNCFPQTGQNWVKEAQEFVSDLFATHLNHKIPLYVSSVPDQNAWDIDALNINWLGHTVYTYPPMALLHRVIQKSGNAKAISF